MRAKKTIQFASVVAMLMAAVLRGQGAELEVAEPNLTLNKNTVSLKHEARHAISRGLKYLESIQAKDGSWSDTNHPAVTALALTSFMGDPAGGADAWPDFIDRGYRFLLNAKQDDGGIYGSNLHNYNTSLAILAFVSSGRPEFNGTIQDARQFVIRQQNDLGEDGVVDAPADGGIGYGGSRDHADLANTLAALEALYHSKEFSRKDDPQAEELNWNAVRQFITRCQNLPETNPQDWASADPANRGGFVYFPGFSQAGETNLTSGRVALRSYGSITYAGLLSFIYADMERDDRRVQAALDWLQENYTLQENPGMGLQGLFYYFHTMTKALTVHGTDKLRLANGSVVNWRQDLLKRLLNLQQPEGHWINENGRWWERDPALVTAYAVLTLELIERQL